MDDRRIFERFAINMPARFLDLDSGREGLAQTQDISAKGIGLVTNEEVKPNSNLDIHKRPGGLAKIRWDE
ncbi:MAG: PilZ domain-containing protein [Candidatus Omnitrophica bacterium]|nr:PilZ domain-containing protein [Candidatus Omnitrophota bacterium]